MRKKRPEPENHERWLVSYADFITLLFAFFVVMFASSQTDKGKAKQISESVTAAFAGGKSMGITPAVAKILGGTVDDLGQGNAMMRGPGGSKHNTQESPPPEVIELLPSMKRLTSDLQNELEAGKLEVHMEARGLVVSLREATFFPSGNDEVAAKSLPVLDKVASVVKSLPNELCLEGHTDSVPIHTGRFPSNWELSAARSIAMLKLLQDRYGVPPERLSIVGHAEMMPLAPNDTPEGRARNRRVDLVIKNTAVRKDTQTIAVTNTQNPPAKPSPVRH